LPPEISFVAGGAIYGVQSSASPLSPGYRKPKAHLHNQTKNVKISLSPVVRSFRTSESAAKIYQKS
jgi:hypothetical protein